MSTKPIATFSDAKAKAIQKGRKGRLLSEEDLFIGFLMLCVAAAIILIPARILHAYPVPQGEEEHRMAPPSAEQRLERLSRELNLDDQQIAQSCSLTLRLVAFPITASRRVSVKRNSALHCFSFNSGLSTFDSSYSFSA